MIQNIHQTKRMSKFLRITYGALFCFSYSLCAIAQADHDPDMSYVPRGYFVAGLTDTSSDVFIRECLQSGYKKKKTCVDLLSEFKKEMARVKRQEIITDSFLIDKYEVSVSDYAQCIDAGVCRLPNSTASACSLLSTYLMYQSDLVYKDHPINCVNRDDAMTYCRWKGKRLPSVDEWERAARGSSDDRPFPWGYEPLSCERVGADFDNGKSLCLWTPKESIDFCWEADPSHPCYHAVRMLATTWPVNSKPDGASPYGVFHMTANVQEWVSDEVTIEGQKKYFVRGGSYSNSRMYLTIFGSNLGPIREDTVSEQIGFRCARSAE